MKTCALVIGHKKTSPGAVNKTQNLSEFDYNEQLAMDIEYALKDQEELRIQKVYRRTYDTLPTDLNELDPDFIISLHCNAFNKKASGTEVLFYHRSKKGKKLAKTLNKSLVGALGLKDRGIKAKSVEDRGGYLLKATHAPCLIAEPFFIDNDKDLEVAETHHAELVLAYSDSIQKMASMV
ncbi:MAG: N-acetylmuramoyl-L-alanine amidase [Pseudomonadota bacterium]|nr:N-acetylmuramoyl-L-alanine amidase [Pseudomonadota bacterium]